MKNSNNNTATCEMQELSQFDNFSINQKAQYDAINCLLRADDLDLWMNMLWNLAGQLNLELEGREYSNYVYDIRRLHGFFDILRINAIPRKNGNINSENLAKFDECIIRLDKQHEAIVYLTESCELISWPDKIWELLSHLDKSVSSGEFLDFIYNCRYLHKFFEILIEGREKIDLL